MLAIVGCGGGASKTNPVNGQNLIDPSGNWKMTFTDSSGNGFLLSALYNQVGAVVTGINFSEVGNGPGATPPTPFNCAAQRDVSIANGLVANVSNFTGDISGNFGTIHFTSTLNDAGTHTVGTYTLTPGSNGNCLGIGLTGNFVGDEVPSISGNWTGTVTCGSNCPVGFTSGTIQMTLTQNDQDGTVTGSYTTSGVPTMTTGNLAPDPAGNNFISGSSVQQRMVDANGNVTFMTGGPVDGLNTGGFGLDRTFGGHIEVDPVYVIKMSH